MSNELKTISKEELITQFQKIERMGWIKNDTRTTNDGAGGNKLEDLLGISENNLPIPNAAEWELKTQDDGTVSLVTLFHKEPSPNALRLVPSLLLPKYGWPHQKAGTQYPESEMSFRATLSAENYTRGFTVRVNEEDRKVFIEFNENEVLEKDKEWLNSVMERTNHARSLEITPYWGFDDLFGKARTKLFNCFFVLYETKKINKVKYFHYYKVMKLMDLNIGHFIRAIREGNIKVDFDARTGHNHGTKFRIVSNAISSLYNNVEIVLNRPKLL